MRDTQQETVVDKEAREREEVYPQKKEAKAFRKGGTGRKKKRRRRGDENDLRYISVYA